ncbi:hypothetical protein [Enterocloster bolteae]|uniref:hypothetical protein n=1 Tax=Enterocloster bolteae TaxID=208479 RepID=UPI002A7FB4EF|nr:hypothetical protein [Enterocloster bolteae]
MDNSLLMSILSSSVIGIIITAIITYYSFNKKNLADNITNERKAWRTDIRDISDALGGTSDYETICKLVTKLESRINAYGIIHQTNYLKDSHLWKLINKIKKQKDSTLFKNKELLINYLSALLKYDWERSKNEIRGNIYIKVIVMSYLISFSLGVLIVMIIPIDELKILANYFTTTPDAIETIFKMYSTQPQTFRVFMIIYRLISTITQIITILLIIHLSKCLLYIFSSSTKFSNIVRKTIVLIAVSMFLLFFFVTYYKIINFGSYYPQNNTLNNLDELIFRIPPLSLDFLFTIFVSYIASCISGILYLNTILREIGHYNMVINYLCKTTEPKKRSRKKRCHK